MFYFLSFLLRDGRCMSSCLCACERPNVCAHLLMCNMELLLADEGNNFGSPLSVLKIFAPPRSILVLRSPFFTRYTVQFSISWVGVWELCFKAQFIMCSATPRVLLFCIHPVTKCNNDQRDSGGGTRHGTGLPRQSCREDFRLVHDVQQQTTKCWNYKTTVNCIFFISPPNGIHGIIFQQISSAQFHRSPQI